MTRRLIVRTSVFVVAVLVSALAEAQLPGGISTSAGTSLLTGGLSKDALLKQAQELVSDLTSMKSSGQLAPAQAKQADDLLPKAQSLTGELEKPQIEPARLPQLASNLSDLQKQVGALKGFMK